MNKFAELSLVEPMYETYEEPRFCVAYNQKETFETLRKNN